MSDERLALLSKPHRILNPREKAELADLVKSGRASVANPPPAPEPLRSSRAGNDADADVVGVESEA